MVLTPEAPIALACNNSAPITLPEIGDVPTEELKRRIHLDGLLDSLDVLDLLNGFVLGGDQVLPLLYSMIDDSESE